MCHELLKIGNKNTKCIYLILALPALHELILSVSLTYQGQQAGQTLIYPDPVQTIVLVWSCVLSYMALPIIDVTDFTAELIRYILSLANNIEAGDADSEYVVGKSQDFLEVVDCTYISSHPHIDSGSLMT